MVPELEQPRVTEIQVRMDCNGCVQKIKKALHGINGIYDIYIDFPNQKLTVVGWADPEVIIKAIRKNRKFATVCSLTEPTAQAAEPPQQAAEDSAPPPVSNEPNPPPTDQPPTAEPPMDFPPPQEKKQSPSPIAVDKSPDQPSAQAPQTRETGQGQVIYHQPPDQYSHMYGYVQSYSGHCNRCLNIQGFHPEQPKPPQPAIHMTQSYNTYRPAPYVTDYVHLQPPLPPSQHTLYGRMDYYNNYYQDNNRNRNIISVFSDENPNACRLL